MSFRRIRILHSPIILALIVILLGYTGFALHPLAAKGLVNLVGGGWDSATIDRSAFLAFSGVLMGICAGLIFAAWILQWDEWFGMILMIGGGLTLLFGIATSWGMASLEGYQYSISINAILMTFAIIVGRMGLNAAWLDDEHAGIDSEYSNLASLARALFLAMVCSPTKYVVAAIRYRLDPSAHFKPGAWGGEGSRKWNEERYWQEYYDDLLNDTENVQRLEDIQYRPAGHALTLARYVSEWPLKRAMSAGCGINAEPHLLAWSGYTVTAVDISPFAIEAAEAHDWSLANLAKAVEVWERNGPPRPDDWKIVRGDIARSQTLLEARRRSGGDVTYIAADWLAIEGSFDLIYCCNGLRVSTKGYWFRTLTRFYEQLAPGGIVAVRTLNAIDLFEDVRDMAKLVGFEILRPDYRPHCDPLPASLRDPAKKYFLGYWPTG